MIDFPNIFIDRAGDRRRDFEIAYLLDQWTADEIATELGISSLIVRDHMRRNIPLDVHEEIVNYLPSTAAQTAELLIQVKSKAMQILRQRVIDKEDSKLLSALISSSVKFLEKYGQVMEKIPSLNGTNVQINYFEKACFNILVDHPDVYLEIKEEMKKLESGEKNV